ncbi:ABC transporter permease [Dactylosporangium cerinum]|uniref:ABC transporter permease n=1 Tax=Dactylosporangium cerinum TaxID=1434730 RepID=A0ABV9W5U9_9ACTN
MTATLRRRLSGANAAVVVAAGVIVFFVLCAAAPQLIATHAPSEANPAEIMAPPGWHHLFGTDYFGRDVFSLVVYGSRDSLLVGVAAVLAGGSAGALLGAVAGYLGGVLDLVLMRIVDIILTVPGVLLALAIAAALGPGFANIVLAISLASIPGYARVSRGQIAGVKVRPFLLAARALGAGRARMLLLHILPNSWSPLLVMAALGLGTSILAGSGLSYLGLSAAKEIPDWGALLAAGRSYITVCWWMSTFPGLAITLFILSVNVLGDRLRDVLDRRTDSVGGLA